MVQKLCKSIMKGTLIKVGHLLGFTSLGKFSKFSFSSGYTKKFQNLVVSLRIWKNLQLATSSFADCYIKAFY